MCGEAWGFSKICAGLLREGTLEGFGRIPAKMQVIGGGSTEAHRVGCVVSKLGGECCKCRRIYAGEQRMDGTCQLFCSWRSLSKIPVPPAHALRLVHASYCISQVFFNFFFYAVS